METWHQAFMSILVEYNKKFKTDGNSEPKKVTEQTNQYQQKSDLVLEYLNDSIEYSEEYKVLASDVYDDFKWWCNDSKNIKVPFDRKGFEVEVGLKKEPSVGGRFNGFRVKDRNSVNNNLDPM
jgi:phage/plasmid-associated DNA primase